MARDPNRNDPVGAGLDTQIVRQPVYVALAALAPAFQAVPVISGTLAQGSTLSVTTGGWVNSPTSYAYQWRRGGNAILNATTSTYALTAADVGYRIDCIVTATNAVGSGTERAYATDRITGAGAGAGGTVSSPPATAPSSIFYASAQRILAGFASPRTLALSTTPPTIDLTNVGNSVVAPAQSLAAGGATPITSVPTGQSGPLDPSGSNFWIVTKPPGFAFDAATGAGRTYAPGSHKEFIYDGRKFDFKATKTSSKTFSILYSEDEAGGWKLWKRATADSIIMPASSQWALPDFGSARRRAIRVIGEDQYFQIYGFNFEAGTTVQAMPYNLARGMVFGDSYVFSQGSSQNSDTRNGQEATKGMTFKVGEYLGTLQAYNDGLRTNGFANNQGGQQAYFHERVDMAGVPEGTHWGSDLDWVVAPMSINDDGKALALITENTRLFWAKMRAAQPTALLLFPVGFACPTGDTNGSNNTPRGDTSASIAARMAGFKAVFGNTPAEWIANGAYMIDGSASGENWVPSGLIGSSPYFPGGTTNPDGATPDYGHPNTAGHAFAGQRYGQGIIALANAIVSNFSPSFTQIAGEDGSLFTTEAGDRLIAE